MSYSCHTEEKAIKPRPMKTTTDNAKAYSYFQDVKRNVSEFHVNHYSSLKSRVENKFRPMLKIRLAHLPMFMSSTLMMVNLTSMAI